MPPTVMRSILMVGMPTPTGTLWPSLPQMPMPSSSLRSLPTMLHVLQSFRPVADQRGVAHRTRELAVLDQVALGRGEDEVAAGDVHLPAAEVGAVEALRHGADDLFGIALARQHEGVGHARHGDVRVAFAPAAAGRIRRQDAAGELVLQIAAQHAVLDQHVALRRVPFVVHIERAAAARDGAVVDDGAELAGHLLADAVR